MNITDATDKVKVGVTLLSGRALTWWRSKASLPPFELRILEWTDFVDELETSFSDVDKVLKLRKRLQSLKQTSNVASYITAFRTCLLELGRDAPDDSGATFQFVENLKPAVRM